MTFSRARRWRATVLLLPPFALGLAFVQARASAGQDAEPGRDHRSRIVPGGGGVQLAVIETGRAGAPPIVFIHGFSQNALTWTSQLRGPLAERHHLVAYDMRGHGASGTPLDPAQYTSSELWAEDLAAVIRSQDLRRPVVVGWSYGGYVIADYVRRYGDASLGGIVFLGAVTKNGSEEAASFLTPEVLAVFGDVLSSEPRSSIAGASALAGMFAERGSPEWEVAFGSAMMVPPAVRQAMFSRALDNDDVLARIRVPTLVIHGAADRIVRVSAGEHIARRVPGARLLVYEGVGHAPHLDAAERFARDLSSFAASTRAGHR